MTGIDLWTERDPRAADLYDYESNPARLDATCCAAQNEVAC